MCNAPKEFFIPTWDTKRISRSKLHKYLIRGKSDEKIFNEITKGTACIYQQTINSGYSSLFIALAKNNENILRKLMEIYENDFKVLKENGYTDKTAVLIAFGSNEIKFIEEKLSKFSSEKDEKAESFLILTKETNESPANARIVTPKNEEEQNEFLKIVEKLYINGTFDVNTNTNGVPLLLVAASQGLIWVMEKLLEMGARHDVINCQGKTPFELACMNYQTETVKWLHKKFNVDLLKFMTEGNGLFSIASAGDFETFDYIMNEIKKFDGDEHVKEIFHRRTEYHNEDILMNAVNAGQFDFVIKCLKYEPDLTNVNSSGSNLLHVVLRTYPLSRDLANILIKKQPNLLLMEDRNQWTPMHLLLNLNFVDELKNIYRDYPSYKNCLFKSFCDTPTIEKEMLNVWNATPGHGALNMESYEMAKFIIDNHSEEFESSEYIAGLLMAVVNSGDSVEPVKLLQTLKCFDVNVSDSSHNFPLYSALSLKRLKIFRHLLESCTIKDLNTFIDQHSQSNLLFEAIWNNLSVGNNGVTYYTECTTVTYDIDSSDDEAEKFKTPNPVEEPTKPEQPPQDIRKEMFDVFMTLINCGVNFGHKAGKLTLLHKAVENDNLEVVEELLKLGLSVEELGNNDETPLHYVKSVEVFEALIGKVSNSYLINIKNSQGQTALLCFLRNFSFDEVKLELFDEFIKNKADIKAADDSGHQPIHVVNTVDWIKILLKHGADVNAVNSEGQNPAHLALQNRNWKVAKFLLHETDIDRFALMKNGNSYLTCLTSGNCDYYAIFDGELRKVFDELVDKHINESGDYGLFINAFIRDGNLKLIQHPKADLHLKEADGQTCLHRAINYKSNLEIVKYLVDSGLDINAVDEKNVTPLMLCFEFDCNEIAEFLISQERIDLNLVDNYGFSALHYAARSNNIEFLCKLLAACADPSTTNNQNKTFFDLLGDFDKKLFAFYEVKH